MRNSPNSTSFTQFSNSSHISPSPCPSWGRNRISASSNIWCTAAHFAFSSSYLRQPRQLQATTSSGQSRDLSISAALRQQPSSLNAQRGHTDKSPFPARSLKSALYSPTTLLICLTVSACGGASTPSAISPPPVPPFSAAARCCTAAKCVICCRPSKSLALWAYISYID